MIFVFIKVESKILLFSGRLYMAGTFGKLLPQAGRQVRKEKNLPEGGAPLVP